MDVRAGWKLAAIFVSGFLCPNPEQVGFAQRPEPCVLAGAVLNSATNAGIPHALVSYFGPATGYRFTDAGGNFQVENVPCAPFSLTVAKPGFVSGREQSPQLNVLSRSAELAALGAESTDQSGRPPSPENLMVELKPGSQPVRIPLVPVSSIAGMVLDENSEPLAGVFVQGITLQASLSGTDYIPAQTARADDRGHYALLSLTPGDYVVRLAGEVSYTRYFLGNTLSTNNDHRGLQPVYYPNVDALSSASVLHLVPGERANADFRQATEAAFDINGRLSGFVPQAWTQMQLYRDGDRVPVGGAFVNLSSGQFRVVDAARGNYTLRAVQYQADPPKWFAAEVPVMVTSEPIRNLVVPLSSGVDIPVSVSYEAGAQDDGQVQLTLQPQHTRDNVRRLSIGMLGKARRLLGTDRSDLTPQPDIEPSRPAALTNVIPDKYRLSVEVIGSGSGYVASAKLGEVDVLHGEFPVGGSAAGELHVTIRGDSATLEGRVTFAGQALIGAPVYLISTTGAGTGIKVGYAGAEGHYKIGGVPPGDYRVRAWAGSPTAKDILSGSGETLTLQPGEHRTVALEATPVSDTVEHGLHPL
jgi:hypothetical protein